MSKYLLLPMTFLLFANSVQAQLEWGYQCKLTDRDYPDHANNVQRIDMFPGGAIVKVKDDNTGEFGGSGKVYKELANTEKSYVIGVLVKSDATTENHLSGDVVYPPHRNRQADAELPRDCNDLATWRLVHKQRHLRKADHLAFSLLTV